MAARVSSLNTFAPIEAATNISPTRVAQAVPTSRKKSCQPWTRSEKGMTDS